MLLEEAEYSMNQHLENRRVYDQYAERPKLTKAFFVRAFEACSAMEIELSMVERRRTTENPFWTNMSAENIITELMVTPRGVEIHQIRAFIEQIINEYGSREYQRVFTDRSLIGNKIGCAIVHDLIENQNNTCRTENDFQC
jgi:hypothetical protein